MTEATHSLQRAFIMLVMEDYCGSFSEALLRDPALDLLSYDECVNELLQQGIYYGDAYLDAFAGQGLKAVQVVPDCVQLQRKWAVERNLRVLPEWASRAPFRWWWKQRFDCDPDQWVRERILLDQVELHRPRFLWFFSGTPISTRLLRRCREFADRLILWWACPLDADVPYADFDLVLSGIPDLVSYFQTLGIKAALMPHAFDSRVLRRIQTVRPRNPKVAFVGAASPHHVERMVLLDLLARHVDVDIYGSGWDFLPPNSPLARCYRGPAWGDRVYEVYGSSALAVHHNINVAGRSLSAKRLFEATGMGACVLAQEPTDENGLFKPESEIVTYKTREECLQKARHFVDHVEDAERIGAAAQQRTLTEHLYPHRVRELVGLLEQMEFATPSPGSHSGRTR